MKLIEAQEKYLSFKGDTNYALALVESIRKAFEESGNEMPKMLNDFIFNIEVRLQDIGVLDINFNQVGE
jgi:hypothetical protein